MTNLLQSEREVLIPTQEELAHLLRRRVEVAEEERTAGKWVLTPEGRAYARELWPDREWIPTLIAEVERLEAALASRTPSPASAGAGEPVAIVSARPLAIPVLSTSDPLYGLVEWLNNKMPFSGTKLYAHEPQ